MKKRMMNKATKTAINAGRLTDNREQYPVEWLLKDTCGSGYLNNMYMIMDAVLCMDKNHPNYSHLNDEDKQRVEELLKHQKIVECVLITTFQWFGTSVGKHTIGELMDEIRKLKFVEQKELCKLKIKTTEIEKQSQNEIGILSFSATYTKDKTTGDTRVEYSPIKEIQKPSKLRREP